MRGLAPHAVAGNAPSGYAFPYPAALCDEVERQSLGNALTFDLYNPIAFAVDVRPPVPPARTGILDRHIAGLIRYDKPLTLMLCMAELDQPPTVTETQALQRGIGLAQAQFPSSGIELVQHSEGRALPGDGNCDPADDDRRQSNKQSQIRPPCSHPSAVG